MSHAFFAPSAAARWIACPGSMAFAENQREGGSSNYADDGTASHRWAAECLMSGQDAAYFIGTQCALNGKPYAMDEERAAYVQIYLDDVRRRALGGHLLVEVRVPGETPDDGRGGTPDVRIMQPSKKLLIIEDLKYGVGEKVWASYEANGKRYPNEQLAEYAYLGLPDALLFGEVEKVLLVVCQPRLDHIDEAEFTMAEIIEHSGRATTAVREAGHAMMLTPGDSDLELYLNPGTKQCRWCRAKAICPKLAKVVAQEVRADFETIVAQPPPAPVGTEQLSRASIALPLIETWCRAVRSALWNAVAGKEQVIGPDGQPYKIVEGDEGKRVWTDPAAAEAALVGQLGPKAYTPQSIITAPAAGKLLDKAKTKALWQDIFTPLIERKKGKPQLALGSDPRTPYTGAADAGEFDDDISA